MLEEVLAPFRASVENELRNMHLEIIHQFHVSQVRKSGSLEGRGSAEEWSGGRGRLAMQDVWEWPRERARLSNVV
jgi:hypothetical protein